ncbi:hypothetical protein QTP88_023613 [Uroleucon formosanum]
MTQDLLQQITEQLHNVGFMSLQCLRWFILGKHSHSVFSENTNIEDGHKDKLLNDCKCITSDLFYNLKLSEEICNDQLETESHNTCLKETDIPELHFDLLKQFEQITEQLHNVGFMSLQCLRWFILGKHSHSVFSENTNIEDGHKDKLLNDCKCITSDLFYNLKLSEEICNDQLETESHNTCLKETDIPELHFDLLKQFEQITEQLHNVGFMSLQCLRWFILGKHSHSVFSENTNIEDGHKDKLLNDCKCITSDLFYNLKLSEEICNDQLETESHNTCLKETDIPELHFDLLKQFEKNGQDLIVHIFEAKLPLEKNKFLNEYGYGPLST